MSAKTKKKTVLAIDDDPDILKMVELALSPYYNVKTGKSAKECRKLIKSAAPDLIILDVMMSHLNDGLNCVKDIKKNTSTKEIPVIMLTSVDQVYDYKSQVDSAFFPYDRWLNKPVKSDELIKTVKEILG